MCHPQMDALGNYLSMGGYGPYIWPAYGVTALVLVAQLVDTVGRLRRRRAELAQLEAAGRRGSAAAGRGIDDA